MRRLAAVLVVLAVVGVVGASLLRRSVPSWVGSRLGDALGLAVEVDAVGLAWRTGRVRLLGLDVRTADGTLLLHARRLDLGTRGMDVLRGRIGVLDGLRAAGVRLGDGTAADVAAPVLRVRPSPRGLQASAHLRIGGMAIRVTGADIDVSDRRARAWLVSIVGGTLAGGGEWDVDVERLVARDVAIAGGVVTRLHAQGVSTTAPPRGVKVVLSRGDGEVRARWNEKPPRLDVKLTDFPARETALGLLTVAGADGGVVTAALSVGRTTRAASGWLRVGPTRLERAEGSVLGWNALAARIDWFDLSSLRLALRRLTIDGAVVEMRRTAEGVWPVTGWEGWAEPSALARVAERWRQLAQPFAAASGDVDRPARAAGTLTKGALTFVDETVSPSVRVSLEDVDGRVDFAADRGLEAEMHGRLPPAGSVDVRISDQPELHLDLDLTGLPLTALAGYAQVAGQDVRRGTLDLEVEGRIRGQTVPVDLRVALRDLAFSPRADGEAMTSALGISPGRALALAGEPTALTLDVHVDGDRAEPRYGLASRTARAVVAALRDRITKPLLETAMEQIEDDVEVLKLPLVEFGRDRTVLDATSRDTTDRLAVLLRQYPELEVTLLGQFDAGEQRSHAAARADAMRARLTRLGLGERVLLVSPRAGSAGVVMTIRSRL